MNKTKVTSGGGTDSTNKGTQTVQAVVRALEGTEAVVSGAGYCEGRSEKSSLMRSGRTEIWME